MTADVILGIPIDNIIQRIAKRHSRDPTELKAALVKELNREKGGVR